MQEAGSAVTPDGEIGPLLTIEDLPAQAARFKIRVRGALRQLHQQAQPLRQLGLGQTDVQLSGRGVGRHQAGRLRGCPPGRDPGHSEGMHVEQLRSRRQGLGQEFHRRGVVDAQPLQARRVGRVDLIDECIRTRGGGNSSGEGDGQLLRLGRRQGRVEGMAEIDRGQGPAPHPPVLAQILTWLQAGQSGMVVALGDEGDGLAAGGG